MSRMSDFPSFQQFYHALHGRDPFPWQSRLAELVRESGWPSDIGVPTGLGKTACIDVAVWSLASQSQLPAGRRRLPRRIWYVVDRRLLVDAASDHALHLSALLSDPPSEPIRAVAAGLRAQCATPADQPLHVWSLRGGADPGATPGGRAPDPAQPAIICSTVAMYASRLLFRGYGASRSMWPIEAAHAGTDSLVLLDEAHLAVPLQKLVGVLQLCDANRTGILRYAGRHSPTGGPEGLLPASRAYPQLVNLTATGNTSAFDLDGDDQSNAVVAKRLAASKPTRLAQTKEAELPATLAGELMTELSGRGQNTSAVVFVNDPATARAVAHELGSRKPGFELVVLTGQLREPDANQVRSRLLDPVTGVASGTHPNRPKPLVVVATQTLEVGADLDFDVCVSQTAGVRALIQRWGRLNRLGQCPDAAGVLVHPVDTKGGLYGDEPGRIWEQLRHLDPPLDLGPARISRALGQPRDRVERVGELLPAHLWEFVKTTTPPADAAPPEVFFDELDQQDHAVSIIWRAAVPGDGVALIPAPSQRESVDIPIASARDFLTNHGPGHIITDDGSTVAALNPADLRPGSTIVLPADAGGYGSIGWDPTATDTVLDLSPSLRATLHLNTRAVTNLLGHQPDDHLAQLLNELTFDPEEGPDPQWDRTIAAQLGTVLKEASPQLIGASHFRIERFGEDLTPIMRWDLPKQPPSPRIDALDDLSNAPRQGLAEHLAAVGELAGLIAAAIGLPEDVIAAVTNAGRLHDLGKSDQRFQRLLDNHDAEPVAKSAMSQSAWRRAAKAAGWPAGGRHELLSVQLLNAYLKQGGSFPKPDLVRHLVATHHGRGRPLVGVTEEGTEMTTTTTVEGVQVTATTDTRSADWTQPARFRRLCEEYGYWGLALLEAVLRQADHRVSAATEVI